jgi:hypothetical protein
MNAVPPGKLGRRNAGVLVFEDRDREGRELTSTSSNPTTTSHECRGRHSMLIAPRRTRSGPYPHPAPCAARTAPWHRQMTIARPSITIKRRRLPLVVEAAWTASTSPSHKLAGLRLIELPARPSEPVPPSPNEPIFASSQDATTRQANHPGNAQSHPRPPRADWLNRASLTS